MPGYKECANGEVSVRLTNGKNNGVAMGNGGHEGHTENSEDSRKQGCCRCEVLKKLSNGLVAGLENTFYRLGKLVARNPWKFIIISVIVCCVAGLGLMKWHEETEYVKVWLPRGSRMYEEHLWVMDNFPESIRYEAVIVEDENVLSPQSLNAIFDLYQTAQNFEVIGNNTLDTLCIKAGPVCRVNSILELWAYNESVIRSLTTADIYRTVNREVIVSPLYRNTMDLEKILGGIQRDNNSKIVGAKATTMFWFLKKDKSSEAAAMAWEKELIELMIETKHKDLNDLFIYTARTFDDEAMGALSSDVNLLSIGFSLVFIYLSFSIGKYSCIEQKVFDALQWRFRSVFKLFPCCLCRCTKGFTVLEILCLYCTILSIPF